MPERNKMVHLSEKDYLGILDTVHRMHECRTRQDLRTFFQNNFLSLFEAEACGVHWADVDFIHQTQGPARTFEIVGIPENEIEHISKIFPYYESITNFFITSQRAVVAHDIDIPRATLQKEIGNFFTDHPEYDRKKLKRTDTLRTNISVSDPPDFQTSFGISRFYPNDSVWTLRELRMMELLQPHLIQSIKTIAMNEELKKYKALSEALADSPTVLALINPRFQIIFHNQAFKELLPVEPGQKLPVDLAGLIRSELLKYNPPSRTDGSKIQLTFYKLPQGIFRLNLTLLNQDEDEESRCYLLRIKPAVEPFSKMNLFMQEVGLTAREMEIASLVRDGIDDREVGDRLFISIHTVKNHLKNIHQKLNVHTRAKLVAVLNYNDDTNERLRQG